MAVKRIPGLPFATQSDKNGRWYFFDKAGKRISRMKFRDLNRRTITGQRISNEAYRRAGTLADRERTIQQVMKKPPKGWTWLKLASRYERVKQDIEKRL